MILTLTLNSLHYAVDVDWDMDTSVDVFLCLCEYECEYECDYVSVENKKWDASEVEYGSLEVSEQHLTRSSRVQCVSVSEYEYEYECEYACVSENGV